jgi:HSP20 family molecular chaperone IbpA
MKRSAVADMPNIVSGEGKDELSQEFRSLVSRRAYELFEQLGRVDGNDVSHWLRAEDELCVRLPDVQQSGAWYTVSAPVVGVPADRIKVSVEDRGALISAEKSGNASNGGSELRDYSSTYYAVRWPDCVDPETASAYVKSGTLTLVVRRAGVKDKEEEISAQQAKARSGTKRSKR